MDPFVSAANIEQYDHLPDGKRLKILEENKDIYILRMVIQSTLTLMKEKSPSMATIGSTTK